MRATPAIIWAVVGAAATRAIYPGEWSAILLSGGGWGLAYLLALRAVGPPEAQPEAVTYQTRDYESRLEFVRAGTSWYKLPEATIPAIQRVGFHYTYLGGRLSDAYMREHCGLTQPGALALRNAMRERGLIAQRNPYQRRQGYITTDAGDLFLREMGEAYLAQRAPTPAEWHLYARANRQNVNRINTVNRAGEG